MLLRLLRITHGILLLLLRRNIRRLESLRLLLLHWSILKLLLLLLLRILWLMMLRKITLLLLLVLLWMGICHSLLLLVVISCCRSYRCGHNGLIDHGSHLYHSLLRDLRQALIIGLRINWMMWLLLLLLRIIDRLKLLMLWIHLGVLLLDKSRLHGVLLLLLRLLSCSVSGLTYFAIRVISCLRILVLLTDKLLLRKSLLLASKGLSRI